MKEKNAKTILTDVQKTYEVIAGEFSDSRNRVNRDFEEFTKFIRQDSKILDLGCGNGRLLMFLKTTICGANTRHNYTGVDNSESLLEIARQKHPEHNFVKGDQLQIPLNDKSCDIIFNIRAFHHIPSRKLRKEALMEMKRILKDDGFLIISVWNLWQKKYLKELATSIFRCIFSAGAYDYNDTLIKWGKNNKRYYHAFTFREFKQTIKSAGLKIVDFKELNHDFVIIAGK